MTPDTIVAIIGLLGILYIAYRDRNSAGDSLVQDAMAMLDKHEQRIERLESDLRWYRFGVNVLISQLRKLGVTPDWTPDSPRNQEK